MKTFKVNLYRLLYPKFSAKGLDSYLDLKVRMSGGEVSVGEKVRNKACLNISIFDGIVRIGDGCFFNNYVSINCRCKITIGDNCLLGENVYIYDHNHEFKNDGLIKNQGFSLGEVIIGDNVWIGSNTVILPGTKIEDNVVVAAGSVVKGHVSEGTLFIQKRKKEVLRYEDLFY